MRPARSRVFVAELGSGAVDVIDVAAGKPIPPAAYPGLADSATPPIVPAWRA